jgi:hypothetical protein
MMGVGCSYSKRARLMTYHLAPHAKRGLRDPAAPFDPIVTVDQFRTALPRIADTELLKCPNIGRKTVAEIRTIWTWYAAQAR